MPRISITVENGNIPDALIGDDIFTQKVPMCGTLVGVVARDEKTEIIVQVEGVVTVED